ncbi:hypothetical protein EU528_10295 [Candidatus Thorarchaeota archaeon]|nr:MAG: hypothetical protein EU528_10295 [Candidatus Thorarchaeota archaeon]
MKEIYEQWRKDLIDAGELKPDEEIDNIELANRWQKWQMEQLKSGKEGSFGGAAFGEALGLTTVEREPEDEETNIREGIKQALDALLTHAEGASYCMIVVSRAWINFRYKRKKNNLHFQVAGNQYITPLKLEDSDIKRLEVMGIPPEPMSVDIYARDFDEEPRNLDQIVETAIDIFNEIYRVSDDDEAYIELDLGKGETEEILNSIAPFFKHRSGKKFKWNWNRVI